MTGFVITTVVGGMFLVLEVLYFDFDFDFDVDVDFV